MAASVVALCALAAGAWASGDPASGEKVFRKCKACHQVGEGAKSRVGPVLNGVVGAGVAARDDYAYSDVLTSRGADGAIWTSADLNRFLERPRADAPGTKMTFAGLRKASDRADVIAYLATFAAPDARAEEFSVTPETLAIEGDTEYGEYLSSECTTCHQVDGSSDGIPPIAGLDTATFVTAMHAYREGAREHQVMQMITGRLSDEEIASLAVYFESLKD